MTKTTQRILLSTLLATLTACGSSKPANTGSGGNGGSGGTTATGGTTGTGGTNDTAGSTGTGGTATAGSTGTAGSDGGAGATGTAGSDAATDVPVSGDGGVTTTNIKAATGGTVTAGGLTLAIPAGALAVDTDITVAISDGAGLPSASSLVASVYDLGPNGTTFTKPVTLTIAVDAAKLGTKQPVVSYLAAGAWVALTNSQSAAGKVAATTTHFTSFGVLGTDAAACVAMTKTACQACCKATFYKGQNAPLNLAIKSCACKAGSPCETQCAGATDVCSATATAASAGCQTCLNTVGNANPQAACIVASQTTDCQADPDCKAYFTCAINCTDTPTSDAGTDASADAPAACSVGFTDNAPLALDVKIATAPPAATGGAIVPGMYWMTEVRTYTGTGGAVSSTALTYSQTYQFTATEWNADVTIQGQHFPLKTTYTAVGTTFTPTRVCPAGNAITPASYSVIGNTILFTDTGAGNAGRLFVKQ